MRKHKKAIPITYSLEFPFEIQEDFFPPLMYLFLINKLCFLFQSVKDLILQELF